jgi:hypothetical protein
MGAANLDEDSRNGSKPEWFNFGFAETQLLWLLDRNQNQTDFAYLSLAGQS